MIIWTPRMLAAQKFFRAAHDSIGHIRKYSRVPYWNHTERTMALLSTITQDEDLLIGQLGHDYIEDVVPKNSDYTIEMVYNRFGARATSHIIDLTDVYDYASYPNMNRAVRKRHERARLAQIPISSKNGKLVDIIDNTEDIVKNDKNFARVYLREIYLLLLVLKDGDEDTYKAAMNQVLLSIQSLNMGIPMEN